METKDGDRHQQRIDLQPVAGSLHWSQIGFHEAWWNGKGVLKDLHSSLTIIMEMRMIRTSTMKDKEDEDGVVDKDDKHHVVDRHHHKGHHQQYCSKMRKSVPAQGSLPDSSMTYLNHSSY